MVIVGRRSPGGQNCTPNDTVILGSAWRNRGSDLSPSSHERTIQASEAALKTQSDPPLERVCQIRSGTLVGSLDSIRFQRCLRSMPWRRRAGSTNNLWSTKGTQPPRRPQSSSRQRPAEGHRGARPCALWRTGHRRNGRDTGFGEVIENRRPIRCEANCPCTSARDAEPERGAGTRAERQRCRTAVAGCTAECPRERRRAIKMRSNTGSTPQKPLHASEDFRVGALNESPCKKRLTARHLTPSSCSGVPGDPFAWG